MSSGNDDGGKPGKRKADRAGRDDPDGGRAALVRARCVKECTAQGAFRNPGDVLSFEQGRVNPHFRIIEG